MDYIVDPKEYMKHILKNAQAGQVFYLLNKKFWNDWSAYV